MKKAISVILTICIGLAAGTLLTGCDSHEHSYTGTWYKDGTYHWHQCECGEKLEMEEHSTVDYICSVCDSEVFVLQDGSREKHEYNEYGDQIQSTSYDKDGKVTYDMRNEYEYDSEGYRLSKKYYVNDRLITEAVYDISDDGWCYESKITEYEEDGTKVICEYNPDEDMTKQTDFDANGNVILETRFEHEYGDNGKKTTTKTYENDVLTKEVEYTVYEDDISEFLYESKITSYNSDGSKTVCEYNEDLEIVKETKYDVNGNVISD